MGYFHRCGHKIYRLNILLRGISPAIWHQETSWVRRRFRGSSLDAVACPRFVLLSGLVQGHAIVKNLRYRRLLLLACGWICLVLGFLGAFLPVLPTTPFLLLAAAAFSRSSHTLANWLYQHKRFGPTLLAWEQYRIIPLRAKVLATGMIVVSLAYLWLGTLISNGLRVCVTLLILATVVYIWSKPHQRPSA